MQKSLDSTQRRKHWLPILKSLRKIVDPRERPSRRYKKRSYPDVLKFLLKPVPMVFLSIGVPSVLIVVTKTHTREERHRRGSRIERRGKDRDGLDVPAPPREARSHQVKVGFCFLPVWPVTSAPCSRTSLFPLWGCVCSSLIGKSTARWINNATRNKSDEFQRRVTMTMLCWQLGKLPRNRADRKKCAVWRTSARGWYRDAKRTIPDSSTWSRRFWFWSAASSFQQTVNKVQFLLFPFFSWKHPRKKYPFRSDEFECTILIDVPTERARYRDLRNPFMDKAQSKCERPRGHMHRGRFMGFQAVQVRFLLPFFGSFEVYCYRIIYRSDDGHFEVFSTGTIERSRSILTA